LNKSLEDWVRDGDVGRPVPPHREASSWRTRYYEP
jgi:hypothetical protein